MMNEPSTYTIKEFTKEKLTRGGSYLFLMLFQEQIKKQKIKDKLTFEEWENLLRDFGTQPTIKPFRWHNPFA